MLKDRIQVMSWLKELVKKKQLNSELEHINNKNKYYTDEDDKAIGGLLDFINTELHTIVEQYKHCSPSSISFAKEDMEDTIKKILVQIVEPRLAENLYLRVKELYNNRVKELERHMGIINPTHLNSEENITFQVKQL